jgi:hypothetical protein
MTVFDLPIHLKHERFELGELLRVIGETPDDSIPGLLCWFLLGRFPGSVCSLLLCGTWP